MATFSDQEKNASFSKQKESEKQKGNNHSNLNISLQDHNSDVLQFMQNGNPYPNERHLMQLMRDSSAQSNTLIGSENKSSLPDKLKMGTEKLSGQSMDDVQVNYNSSKPAEVGAHAYAQGSEIHLGPGQEQHLPHEAWHVVQQKQGRVSPTKQLKGKQVNDQ